MVSFGTKVVAAGALAVGAIAGITTGILAIGEDIAPLADITSAFDRLATTSGETSAEVLANLQKLSSGLIDEGDLMKDYNLSIQMMGKSLTDQFTTAIPMIEQLAISTGADMGQMVSSFEEGIGRMRPMALAQMGLVIDTSSVYDAYAKSIGKTASELTTQEQQTALLNAAMDQLRTKTAGMAPAADSAQASFLRMNVSLNNLKEGIELAILPLAQKLADAIAMAIPRIQVWLNVLGLYFSYYFGIIKEKFDTFLAGPVGDFIAMFTTGNFSQLPTVLGNLFDGIVKLFWDSFATPIGQALASIPPNWQAPIVVGIGAIATALAVAGIARTVMGIQLAIAALIATGLLPLIGIIAVAALVLVAYANNWLGFRTTVDNIGKFLTGPFAAYLRKVADAINIFLTQPLQTISRILDDLSAKLTNFLNAGGSLLTGQGTFSSGTAVTPGAGGGVTIGIQGRAGGGDVWPGMPFIVGENHPEIFWPGQNGTITQGLGDIHISVTEGNAYRAGQNFGQGLMERLHSRGLQG